MEEERNTNIFFQNMTQNTMYQEQFYQFQQQQQNNQQNQIQNNQKTSQNKHNNNQYIQSSDIDPNYNSVFVLSTRFDVPKYYKIDKPLGTGGYGIVLKAIDQRDQKKVAIKKIFQPFKNQLETKRILREIQILKTLKHENIISINDMFNVLPFEQYNDVYIVNDLMDTDLHQIITSQQELTNEHSQFFTYQLLCGLKYLHGAGIIHRDLKPGNLLLNEDCQLKICDFGLARTMQEENQLLKMTEYVSTRWYRPPELLLTWQTYTTAIDMWAVGLIIAELFLRRPLLPGDSYLKQILMILQLVGTPTDDDMKHILSDRAKEFIKQQPFSKRVNLQDYLPNAPKEAVDLINKCLVFNPEKRITVQEALAHPYFKNISDPEYELSCNRKFMFEYEDKDAESVDELKLKIWNEMKEFSTNFNEKSQTYNLPIQKDEDLQSIDADGNFLQFNHVRQKQKQQENQQPELNFEMLEKENNKLMAKIQQDKQLLEILKLQYQQSVDQNLFLQIAQLAQTIQNAEQQCMVLQQQNFLLQQKRATTTLSLHQQIVLQQQQNIYQIENQNNNNIIYTQEQQQQINLQQQQQQQIWQQQQLANLQNIQQQQQIQQTLKQQEQYQQEKINIQQQNQNGVIINTMSTSNISQYSNKMVSPQTSNDDLQNVKQRNQENFNDLSDNNMFIYDGYDPQNQSINIQNQIEQLNLGMVEQQQQFIQNNQEYLQQQQIQFQQQSNNNNNQYQQQ